jgi:hypothetical protein
LLKQVIQLQQLSNAQSSDVSRYSVSLLYQYKKVLALLEQQLSNAQSSDVSRYFEYSVSLPYQYQKVLALLEQQLSNAQSSDVSRCSVCLLCQYKKYLLY